MQEKVDNLIQDIKHHLMLMSGHTNETATIEEFYAALCSAIKESIIINQTAVIDTVHKKKPRIVNFLSMEYLPGKLLMNNITNIGANELIKHVLAKMNRNLKDIISCDAEPGIGSGGLGRLSSCFLDSLATLHYPARAYGLRYQYGVFEQEIWDGLQIEKPDTWLLNAYPWENRRDLFNASVHFGGDIVHATNKHGCPAYLLENYQEVRAVPYDIPIVGYSKGDDFSVKLLRLWSTKESPRNFQMQHFNSGLLGEAMENTSLTDVLYPNDNTELGKRIRLKQEYLLVAASLKDIIRRHLASYGDLSLFREKVRIQINDTHPALMIAELIRMLTKNYDYSWTEAVETTFECCSYTNHTILKEGLEIWEEDRIQNLLPRQYEVIQRLNQDLCNKVREKFSYDEEKVRSMSIIEDGKIRMAHLAVFGSHKINGVAKIHSKILQKNIFKDFYDLSPEKFTNVTNGITHRRWLHHINPLLSEFITKRIGDDWIKDFTHIQHLKSFAADKQSQEEFLHIKRQNKEKLIEFLKQENPIRNVQGKIIAHSTVLDVDCLFDVQIKRIHEYKRQLLNALHLIMLMIENRNFPRFSIFAGNAAPGYLRAKKIIQLICAIARKTKKVAFVENYSVSHAEVIIPSADLSEQISCPGFEASGTGNMKFAINGALTIGTEDGANIEMRESITDQWWPFGLKKENRPFSDLAQRAINSLIDDSIAQTQEEADNFRDIYESITQKDTYRVLQDLDAYYEMQQKVEKLFQNQSKWAEYAIHNIAGMGKFSTDNSIKTYAKNIWNIEPCPIDPAIYKKVKESYPHN